MPNPIFRISQAPPDAGAPPPPAPIPDPLAGGAPPMDLGMGAPMGGAPMGGAPMGAAPATGPISTPKASLYPLENSGMILLDAEIEKRLKEQFASTENLGTTSEEEIANEIWIEYGGNKFGGVDRTKVGKRMPDKEVDDAEVKRTRDKKWERLPLGKNLDDLGITLDDIRDMVISFSQGIAAAAKKGAGGPGGAPALASLKNNQLIKLAQDIYRESSKISF